MDISGQINLTDDNTNLVGAVVKISAGYVNGEDVLGFANTANITNAWDAATGTLTLSGSDTVANYQAALRAVTYQNTSDEPNTATRTVSFTVDDGAAVSAVMEISVNVASINDAPEAGADSYTLVENTQLSVDAATTIDLTTVNDAPVISGLNTLTYTENDSAAVISNSNNGTLTNMDGSSDWVSSTLV